MIVIFICVICFKFWRFLGQEGSPQCPGEEEEGPHQGQHQHQQQRIVIGTRVDLLFLILQESFSGLRDAIPTMQGDKSSRAQILKKASEYISFMRKKNSSGQRELDDLKRQNQHLEAQIRALERAKNSGQFSSAREVLDSSGLGLTAQEASARMLASDDVGAGEDGGMEEGAAASENGYDASGSDGSPSPAVQQQQQQQQHHEVVTTTAQPQQIHIQQIGGGTQQRVIQVRKGSFALYEIGLLKTKSGGEVPGRELGGDIALRDLDPFFIK